MMAAVLSESEEESGETGKLLECKFQESDSLRFAKVYLQKLRVEYLLHQKSSAKLLNVLSNKFSYTAFRSARARLIWIQ